MRSIINNGNDGIALWGDAVNFAHGNWFTWFKCIPLQQSKLRKYRAIKVVSWRVNFSPRSKSFRATDAIADFEGLLAVNREIGKQQMSEKAPPDVPPYCAVVP